MGVIQIKNMRKEKPKEKWDFRIDRESPLGNPFWMNDESQRNAVCDKYERWFQRMLYEGGGEVHIYLKSLLYVFKEYGKINLFCWCYPKRCHGETIARFLKERE